MKFLIKVALALMLGFFLASSGVFAEPLILVVKERELNSSEEISDVIHRLTIEALREAENNPCVVHAKNAGYIVETRREIQIIIDDDRNIIRVTLLGANC